MSSIDDATVKSINNEAAASAAAATGLDIEAGTSEQLSPGHAEEKARLEMLLKNRSDAKELEDKNILKAGNVAPALQAARIDLEKRQLEDKLEGRLARRPEAEDLERRGILKDQTVAPALQAKMSELERSQLEDRFGKDFAARPDIDELRAKGIIKDGEAP